MLSPHEQDEIPRKRQSHSGQHSKGSLRHSAARSSQSDSALEGMRAELLSSSRSAHSEGALPSRRERLELDARWCGQSDAAESAVTSDGFLTAAEYRSAKSGAKILQRLMLYLSCHRFQYN